MCHRYDTPFQRHCTLLVHAYARLCVTLCQWPSLFSEGFNKINFTWMVDFEVTKFTIYVKSPKCGGLACSCWGKTSRFLAATCQILRYIWSKHAACCSWLSKHPVRFLQCSKHRLQNTFVFLEFPTSQHPQLHEESSTVPAFHWLGMHFGTTSRWVNLPSCRQGYFCFRQPGFSTRQTNQPRKKWIPRWNSHHKLDQHSVTTLLSFWT